MKTTCIQKIRTYNGDETDTWGRFHQHFTLLCESASRSLSLVTFWLRYFFAQNIFVKGECKMLLKLTRAVNFINIYARVFCTKFWRQSQNVLEKLPKRTFVQKSARKNVDEIDTWPGFIHGF